METLKASLIILALKSSINEASHFVLIKSFNEVDMDFDLPSGSSGTWLSEIAKAFPFILF